MARKKSSQSKASRSATAYYRLAQKAAKAGDTNASIRYTKKANQLRDKAALEKKVAGDKAGPNPFGFKKDIF